MSIMESDDCRQSRTSTAPGSSARMRHSSHLKRAAIFGSYSRVVPVFQVSIMSQEFIALIHSIGVTIFKLVPVTIALGVVFAVLSYFWACNPGRPWWRKRELVTDICYWII